MVTKHLNQQEIVEWKINNNRKLRSFDFYNVHINVKYKLIEEAKKIKLYVEGQKNISFTTTSIISL